MRYVGHDELHLLFVGTWDEANKHLQNLILGLEAEELDTRSGCPDCLEMCRASLKILVNDAMENTPVFDDELSVDGNEYFIFPVPVKEN